MLMAPLVAYLVLGMITTAAIIAAAIVSGRIDKSSEFANMSEAQNVWPFFPEEDPHPFIVMARPRMANHDLNCKEAKAAFLGNSDAMYEEMRVWKEKQQEAIVGTFETGAT